METGVAALAEPDPASVLPAPSLPPGLEHPTNTKAEAANALATAISFLDCIFPPIDITGEPVNSGTYRL
jgi:hypothetical protein